MEEITKDMEIQVIQRDVPSLKDKVEALEVYDENSEKMASAYLSRMTNAIKLLESKRVFFTKPILDSKRRIDMEFQNMIHPIDSLCQTLKQKLVAYNAKKRRDEIEKQKKIEEFAKANELPVPEVVQAPVSTPVRTALGTTFTTKRWAWKVLDETKIPREYLIIDEKKINAMMKAHIKVVRGENTMSLKVDGIEFFQEESISVRS